jgi:hypothetical protein
MVISEYASKLTLQCLEKLAQNINLTFSNPQSYGRMHISVHAVEFLVACCPVKRISVMAVLLLFNFMIEA